MHATIFCRAEFDFPFPKCIPAFGGGEKEFVSDIVILPIFLFYGAKVHGKKKWKRFPQFGISFPRPHICGLFVMTKCALLSRPLSILDLSIPYDGPFKKVAANLNKRI